MRVMPQSIPEHADQSFFTRAARAASLIPQIPGWVAGPMVHHHNRHGSMPIDGAVDPTNRLDSSAVNESAEREAVYQENLESQRIVRTLPPWVHSLQEDDDVDEVDVHSTLLPQPQVLPESHKPHRNHTPAPRPRADPGRAFDHERKNEAVTMSAPIQEYASRWQAFAQASAFPRSVDGEIVTEKWLNENLADLTQPWNAKAAHTEKQRHDSLWLFDNSRKVETIKSFQRILLRNPFVPLVIRVIVLCFVTAALALGVLIYKRSNSLNSSPQAKQAAGLSSGSTPDAICKQQASTYLAFTVDAAAVIYLIYITWDEYFSAPLGLRSSRSKMRLLFLDLIFIVFSAANLSLAFNTLEDDQWSCYDGSLTSNLNNSQAARTTCIRDDTLCDHQKSLCSVLLVALIAWLGTFSISTMRVVERISR